MAQDIVAVTTDLYRFLLAAEGLTLRRNAGRENPQVLLTRAQELGHRLNAAAAHASDRVDATLAEASQRLKAFVAELHEAHPDAARRMRRAWSALGESYEALRAATRSRLASVPAKARPGPLKPRNYARNLFHVVMAVTGVLLYELVLGRGAILVVAGVLLAGFIGLEIARRLSPRFNARLVAGVFGAISRPGEAHEVPAATWYLAALLLSVLLFPQHAAELGVLVLGFGDPAASLAGKRWGRVKLFGPKSLAGTLAFFLVAAAVGAVFLMLVRPDLGLAPTLGVAAGVAAAGAMTELLTGTRLDDNFTIPIVSGATAMGLLLLV